MGEKPVCSIAGCGNPVKARGYCQNHYLRLLRHGDPLLGRGPNIHQGKPCAMQGCERPHQALGLCQAHYFRLRNHGSPTGGGPALSPVGSGIAWINARLAFEGNECLIWPFARQKAGYAVLKIEGKQINVHRWVCEQVNGPPPSKIHQAAHSCGKGRSGCVSPKHLRWATPKENCRDMVSHGTSRHGKPGNPGKLCLSDVLEIRRNEGGLSQQKLAEMYGVTQTNISAIQTRKTFQWL